MEFDAAGRILVDAQHVGQVPGDGLAFAVRVSREIDFAGGFGFLADLAQDFATSANGDVLGFKVIVHIYADLALGQVANMALGGLDPVATPQELTDRLCLGR